MTIEIAQGIWLACVVAWYVIRFPYERRTKRKNTIVASRKDTAELTLLTISLSGLGIVPMIHVLTSLAGVRSPFAFADYAFSPAMAWIGTAVFVGSLALFVATHRQLGRNWSVSLEMRQDHRLVTDGVYTHVRHPMYTAFVLWAVAQAFLLNNWIAGAAGLVGFGILFFGRVGREEAMMIDTFGDEYRAYMERTRRIIPRIY